MDKLRRRIVVELWEEEMICRGAWKLWKKEVIEIKTKVVFIRMQYSVYTVFYRKTVRSETFSVTLQK